MSDSNFTPGAQPDPAQTPQSNPYAPAQPYPGAPTPQNAPAQPYAAPQQPHQVAQPPYAGAQPQHPAAQQPYPGAQQQYAATQQYPGAQPQYPGAQPQYPGVQPYYPQPRPTNGLAVTSLVTGIVGILFSWTFVLLLASIAAVITGHIALKQLRPTPEAGGRGMAITGLILGYFGAAIIALGLVIGLFSFLLVGTAGLLPFYLS